MRNRMIGVGDGVRVLCMLCLNVWGAGCEAKQPETAVTRSTINAASSAPAGTSGTPGILVQSTLTAPSRGPAFDKLSPADAAGASATAVAPPPRLTAASYPPPKNSTIALESNHDDPLFAQLAAGDAAIDNGTLDEAKRIFERAKVKAPRAPGPALGLLRVRMARLNLGSEYAIAKGNTALTALVHELDTLRHSAPDYAPVLVDFGRANLVLGDAPTASLALRDALRLLPDQAEVHSTLAIAELARGHLAEAIAPAARAVELDPGSSARHGNYGTVLLLAGRVREAIAEYEIQVVLAENEPRAHSDLGTALLADNRADEAIRALSKAIALDPKRATFHSNLGYALQIQGNRAGALREYETAIALDRALASAWINMATVLAADKATRPRARAALETARKLDATDPRVQANMDELDALEKAHP